LAAELFLATVFLVVEVRLADEEDLEAVERFLTVVFLRATGFFLTAELLDLEVAGRFFTAAFLVGALRAEET